MSRQTVSGHFIKGTRGSLFVLLRRPARPPLECVLFVPPFAEEMNKCRRMFTEVAIGLADSGVIAVLPDLYGTGDSGGDFADGDWETWQSDLAAVARWCLELGHPVTGLLAVRLGCALAVASADKGFIPAVRNSVLWQPVFDGNRFLSQFLRMRVASGLMQARKETVADLRIMLQNFKEVEVGGYLLSKRLADDIECIAVPDVLPQSLGRVSWLEVTRQSDTPLPAVSQELVERTQSRGGIVHVVCASGEPFWSTTEITLNADLVGESIALFSQNPRESPALQRS